MFSTAKPAEIIRSNQKDDYYSSYVKGTLADLVHTAFGPRIWIKWRKELDLLADVGYFGLTTLAGYQTLGEEYVNILQVDSTRRAIPLRLVRGAMILLQVAFPYLLDYLLNLCQRHLRQNTGLALTPDARSRLLELIPVLRHVITILHRCHLAVFYLRGAFYHFAKRMTGIQYVLVRQGVADGMRPSYRVLGWLSVLQLSFTFLQQLAGQAKHKNREGAPPPTSELESEPVRYVEETTRGYVDPSRKCSLCLEARKHSTATPCGHIFCWNCITAWCSSKPECPLCRETFEMSRLIYLKNYDPV